MMSDVLWKKITSCAMPAGRDRAFEHLVWHDEIQVRGHLFLRSRFDLSKLRQSRRLCFSLASQPALFSLEECSIIIFAGRVDKLI